MKLWKKVSLRLFFGISYFIFMSLTMMIVFALSNLFADFVGVTKEGQHLLLVWFIIMNLVIGSVISFIFGKVPIKPFQILINGIDQLANGEFNARIYLSGPDIFKKLSKSFNRMASELESTEILRRDFVNNYSHEFKTPIASIAGFAKLLKDDQISDTEKHEYLDIIISETERLSDLSTNVLNLSKVERQRYVSDKTVFNVTEQLRQVVVLLEGNWLHKNLSLNFEGEDYDYLANEEMMYQVWVNLISNAIKFSYDHKELGIKIIDEHDNLRVLISNQGDVIPVHKRQKIFEEFYQIDDSRKTEGNGLGLPLVRRILDLHQSTVMVKQSDETATVFEVILKKNPE